MISLLFQLNVNPVMPEEPKAHIYFKIYGYEYYYIPFDRRMMEDIVDLGNFVLRCHVEGKLENIADYFSWMRKAYIKNACKKLRTTLYLNSTHRTPPIN